MRSSRASELPYAMSTMRRIGEVNPASKLPDDYLFDAWYVAAWGEEITRDPMRRLVLDEPVVFYRRTDGAPVALADRCVHRAFPLSRGRPRGDDLVCGYHGFAFDAHGICTSIPGQTHVPKTARVRAFPLVESGPFVWIWMGAPESADPATIPDHRFACDAGYGIIKDRAVVKARHALLIDNLMDLSHETFVHAATIGTPEVAETPIRVEVDAPIVRCYRHIQAAESPPFYQSFGMIGTIDRRQDIEFHVPSFYTLHSRIAPHGAGDDAALVAKIMYAVTPETRRTTHDFWVIARPGRSESAWRGEAATAFQNRILQEDIEALEALEANLPPDGRWQEMSVRNDAGGIQWRRVFGERLLAERELAGRIGQRSGPQSAGDGFARSIDVATNRVPAASRVTTDLPG